MERIHSGRVYALPLLGPRNGQYTLPSLGAVDDGYFTLTAALDEAGEGYPCEAIREADLPAPLDNPAYTRLQLYTCSTPFGACYIAVWYA